MKLVFATNNRHKLDEVRKITSGYTEIVSLSEINCHEDIPETAETLEGNALQKARYIKEHFGYDCFADDTGLEVEALHNAPGVYSARYAGPGHDSEPIWTNFSMKWKTRKTGKLVSYGNRSYLEWKRIFV